MITLHRDDVYAGVRHAAVSSAVGLISWLASCLGTLVLDRRVFCDMRSADKTSMNKVLSVARGMRHLALNGHDYKMSYIPALMVSWSFVIVTNIDNNMYGVSSLTVTVWRWRWLPHMVPAPALDVPDYDRLVVHRRRLGETDVNRTREMVVPPGHVQHGTFVCADVDDAMEHMLDLHKAQKGQRFLIMGPKGCGKTTLARRFAHCIRADMYMDWDPTVHGDDLQTIFDIDTKDHSMLIYFPECNVAIERISRKDPLRPSDKVVEVHDKTSWCNVFDRLVLDPHTTLIMDSNKTEAEIDELDVPHQGALLRHGRITARIVISGMRRADSAGPSHSPKVKSNQQRRTYA